MATPVSLVEWFLNFYEEACEGDVRPVEGVVRAGEVLFVPRGWWHMAINLEVLFLCHCDKVREPMLKVACVIIVHLPQTAAWVFLWCAPHGVHGVPAMHTACCLSCHPLRGSYTVWNPAGACACVHAQTHHAPGLFGSMSAPWLQMTCAQFPWQPLTTCN